LQGLDVCKGKMLKRLCRESYLGQLQLEEDLQKSYTEFYLELKKNGFKPVPCFIWADIIDRKLCAELIWIRIEFGLASTDSILSNLLLFPFQLSPVQNLIQGFSFLSFYLRFAEMNCSLLLFTDHPFTIFGVAQPCNFP
jgi:hypothetical protein